MIGYLAAGEIVAGMQAFESDGYPVDIVAVIRETKATITLSVNAQGCMVQTKANEKTLRKSTRILVDVGERDPSRFSNFRPYSF